MKRKNHIRTSITVKSSLTFPLSIFVSLCIVTFILFFGRHYTVSQLEETSSQQGKVLQASDPEKVFYDCVLDEGIIPACETTGKFDFRRKLKLVYDPYLDSITPPGTGVIGNCTVPEGDFKGSIVKVTFDIDSSTKQGIVSIFVSNPPNSDARQFGHFTPVIRGAGGEKIDGLEMGMKAGETGGWGVFRTESALTSYPGVDADRKLRGGVIFWDQIAAGGTCREPLTEESCSVSKGCEKDTNPTPPPEPTTPNINHTWTAGYFITTQTKNVPAMKYYASSWYTGTADTPLTSQGAPQKKLNMPVYDPEEKESFEVDDTIPLDGFFQVGPLRPGFEDGNGLFKSAIGEQSDGTYYTKYPEQFKVKKQSAENRDIEINSNFFSNFNILANINIHLFERSCKQTPWEIDYLYRKDVSRGKETLNDFNVYVYDIYNMIDKSNLAGTILDYNKTCEKEEGKCKIPTDLSSCNPVITETIEVPINPPECRAWIGPCTSAPTCQEDNDGDGICDCVVNDPECQCLSCRNVRLDSIVRNKYINYNSETRKLEFTDMDELVACINSKNPKVIHAENIKHDEFNFPGAGNILRTYWYKLQSINENEKHICMNKNVGIKVKFEGKLYDINTDCINAKGEKKGGGGTCEPNPYFDHNCRLQGYDSWDNVSPTVKAYWPFLGSLPEAMGFLSLQQVDDVKDVQLPNCADAKKKDIFCYCSNPEKDILAGYLWKYGLLTTDDEIAFSQMDRETLQSLYGDPVIIQPGPSEEVEIPDFKGPEEGEEDNTETMNLFEKLSEEIKNNTGQCVPKEMIAAIIKNETSLSGISIESLNDKLPNKNSNWCASINKACAGETTPENASESQILSEIKRISKLVPIYSNGQIISSTCNYVNEEDDIDLIKKTLQDSADACLELRLFNRREEVRRQDGNEAASKVSIQKCCDVRGVTQIESRTWPAYVSLIEPISKSILEYFGYDTSNYDEPSRLRIVDALVLAGLKLRDDCSKWEGADEEATVRKKAGEYLGDNKTDSNYADQVWYWYQQYKNEGL